jgi:glycosyltransferase involved in cell wall biosynthesis
VKTALIHDWLTAMGGGERALQALYQLYPSPIYTLFADPKTVKESFFADKQILTSFLQKLPFVLKKYRSYLPFFPMAIEQFNLEEFDLIISSSHCVAKGAIPRSGQVHVCYCYTPVRYAWDLYHSYLKDANLETGIKGFFAKLALHRLRMWDQSSCHRVDHFIADSHLVRERIERTYGRQADVVYPPIDTDYFAFHEKKEEYYVTASRMVPYKRIDIIVEAFSTMPEKRLVVIGDGPEMGKIKKLAGKNVEFLGRQPDAVLRDTLQKAKAFLFAAVEDFGIVPVEAMSCGTPVIAYGAGAILETVKENETGLLYRRQTPQSLRDKIAEFEQMDFDPFAIRKHAEGFSLSRFHREFKECVDRVLREKGKL